MKRLALFGALATLPFVALGGLAAGWWPLNILFTLWVITAALYFVERGGAVLDRRTSKPTSNQALTAPHERPLGRRSSQEWACRAFRSYGMGLGNSWPRPNRHI